MHKDVPPFHRQAIWYYMALVALGFWHVATSLCHDGASVILQISDIASGLLLMLFGSLALRKECAWAPWAAFGVGVWLQFAPLVFWAPLAVTYFNDTLVGALAIALAILIPGTRESMQGGPDRPPGWTYNPSSPWQRLPVVSLAGVCYLVARYMACYQLGYLSTIWDPVFGEGTQRVITSDISRAFPISDAGLGALIYTLEALLGCKGSGKRWYTMPWLVLVFGMMVVPAGLVSVVLIILQPVIIGNWCFWCLLTALSMLFMIAFAVDELIASIQYLSYVKRRALPFWSIFWKGGEYPHGEVDIGRDEVTPSMTRGVSFSWNLIASGLLGLTLMFTPSWIGLQGVAAHAASVIGALIITGSVIASAEVIRKLRRMNGVWALWLIVAPWILVGYPPVAQAVHVAFGLLLMGLSLPKGHIRETYGSWMRHIA